MNLHQKITIKGMIAEPRERIWLNSQRNPEVERLFNCIFITVELFGWKHAIGLYQIAFNQ